MKFDQPLDFIDFNIVMKFVDFFFGSNFVMYSVKRTMLWNSGSVHKVFGQKIYSQIHSRHKASTHDRLIPYHLGVTFFGGFGMSSSSSTTGGLGFTGLMSSEYSFSFFGGAL